MTITEDQPMVPRALIARVRNILLRPRAEWAVIDAEPATIRGLYTGYVCILAAIGPVCGVVGQLVFGFVGPVGVVRPSLGGAVLAAAVSYGLTLLGVYVMALVIEALAPTFGGQKDRLQAFKVSAYAPTAGWIAGVFGLVPMLAILSIVGLYSLYLLYLGLPRLMKTSGDKALAYTAVVIVIGIGLSILIGLVTAPLLFLGRGFVS